MVFLGIGGIGMSAIARHYLRSGIPVFGYDKTESELTRALAKEGAIITYDFDPALYPGWSAEDTSVIYTPALPSSLGWFEFFSGFETIKRAEALGRIANQGKCLAVGGTHGKTSTSAMLVHLLTECGMDPTAFIGGIMTGTGTNYRLGNSDLVVVEADEFDRSFLHLQPWAAAITTIDEDHLDIYDGRDDLLETFNLFNEAVQGPTFTGTILGNTTAIGTEGSHCWAGDVRPANGAYSFTLNLAGENEAASLRMPGRHNIYNALLAASLAHYAGASVKDIAKALASFEGIKRRFEYHLEEPRVVIEDYAHHPTEIEALMDSMDEFYPNKKIALVFQPHLYSRTRDFMEGFKNQLSRAEKCYLLPIYPARELPIEGITSQVLASGISGAQVVAKEQLTSILLQSDAEVILFVGAGDIGLLVEPFKAALA